MYKFSPEAAEMYEFLVAAAAFFSAFACRGGAASTEIASWGAAGCPAIADGRADKWAEGAKGGGGRARAVLCINSKLAIGWLLFFFV
jgi:hypothetical protein